LWCRAGQPLIPPRSVYANGERLGTVFVEPVLWRSKPNTEQLQQGRMGAKMKVLVRVVEARGIHDPHPQAKFWFLPRRRCDQSDSFMLSIVVRTSQYPLEEK
jgi:hypothetical protein